MDRLFLLLASFSGLSGVALGAFGAHGLRDWLGGLADGAQRLGWWQTGAHYHLVHALALGLVALVWPRAGGTALSVAGWAFVAGTLLFSGSLYAMTLTGVRVLGAVTPLGGLGFMVGWAALGWAAYRAQRP
jgi:uncharacterized membrane protein YgdD (TMEM256/DUF423 family)